ncbi:GTP-binding protein [Heterostelium album PN500]|uniref:GTP-binding protein n=1 Tax=Heterostelium pallidum (strain ATCC 26659 / Pp 5 / PN500) TaxID=670386 RepID=D3BV27_HETP5|nr:GTP-binding protein [Heterostelium album PN500]EFA74965.1 GTP-binding protein [Heterostelium album PN500]|eukprot:XP_020427099.1 GTP-binding protein [Heterostelium album PN500]
MLKISSNLFKGGVTTRFNNIIPINNCSSSFIGRYTYATETPKEIKEAKASYFVKTRGSCKSAGIVGLPNVGKSTLFNALTSSQAAMAANFPFCTIDPNVGLVFVPDERLDLISKKLNTKSKVGTQLEFVDIAGLVKGAADGEGLGNKFLANIRQVSLIVHLVRCFEDSNITHVHDAIDPVKDLETIEMELILADLQSLEKIIAEPKKRATPEQTLRHELAIRIRKSLEGGLMAREIVITDKEWPAFQSLHLLTGKPMLYTCNVGESDAATGNKYTDMVKQYSQKQGLELDPVVVSAKIESEVSLLESDEMKQEFLQLYGLERNGLYKVINGARQLMGLQSYYTASEKECRAWTIPIGTKAKQAAGVIHTDFEKGFIKADLVKNVMDMINPRVNVTRSCGLDGGQFTVTISYQDFIDNNCDDKLAKEKGKQRSEGPLYEVKDGDVLFFKFN